MDVKTPFIHLRVHSDYSLLQSALKLKEITELTRLEKMPAVAVTDINNLFGALEFSQMTLAAGVQPLIGAELYVERPASKNEVEKKYDTLVFLVQNEQGYKNLIKLVSQAHLQVDATEDPHVTFQQIETYHEGLLCLTASVQGGISKLFLAGKKKEAEAYFLKLKTLFEGRIYLELTRQGLQEEVKAEPFLLDLALKHECPIVATNPCFFANKGMHEAHTILMCISDGSHQKCT